METVLRGRCWVIDGDTIVINNIRVRLAGIDAPELDHPWGQRSKWALVQLCKGQTVTARIKPVTLAGLAAEPFNPVCMPPSPCGGISGRMESLDLRRPEVSLASDESQILPKQYLCR